MRVSKSRFWTSIPYMNSEGKGTGNSSRPQLLNLLADKPFSRNLLSLGGSPAKARLTKEKPPRGLKEPPNPYPALTISRLKTRMTDPWPTCNKAECLGITFVGANQERNHNRGHTTKRIKQVNLVSNATPNSNPQSAARDQEGHFK